MSDDQKLVDLIETCWRSIDDLCSGLTAEEWELATDCPRWSVKDHISHLTGLESRFAGRPVPDHKPADMSHCTNPIAESNEIDVDYRRSRSGPEVLEEFRDVTGERLKTFRGWAPEEFDKESWTPVGPGKVRDFLGIRLFDSWVHEQDIRRAVGKPGSLDGDTARQAFARLVSAMPFVVGKKAAAPDGTTVVFDITGPVGGRMAVAMQDGRGKPVDPPTNPTVTLAMDLETFNALGCGRWTSDRALGDGRVTIDGDRELGERIAGVMGFMI